MLPTAIKRFGPKNSHNKDKETSVICFYTSLGEIRGGPEEGD